MVDGGRIGPTGESLGDWRVGDLGDVRAVEVSGVDVGGAADFEREDDPAAVGRVARAECEVVIGPDVESDGVCSGPVGTHLDEDASGVDEIEMLAVRRPARPRPVRGLGAPRAP